MNPLSIQIRLNGGLSGDSRDALLGMGDALRQLGHSVTLTRPFRLNGFPASLAGTPLGRFIPGIRVEANDASGSLMEKMKTRHEWLPGVNPSAGFDLSLFSSWKAFRNMTKHGSREKLCFWALASEQENTLRDTPPQTLMSDLKVIYDTEWTRKQFQHNGEANETTPLIPAGIETEFRRLKARTFTGPLQVLTLFEETNQDGFFNAIETLGRLFVCGLRLRITVVSPRKLADCGLGETVVVKPDTSILAELMQTHHILLLPGRFSPSWLVRGMASGMAVFSAPIGLAAETSRQQTQLAAPADASPETWADELRGWIERPNELEALGERARMAMSEYTPLASARRLLEAVLPGKAVTPSFEDDSWRKENRPNGEPIVA